MNTKDLFVLFGGTMLTAMVVSVPQVEEPLGEGTLPRPVVSNPPFSG